MHDIVLIMLLIQQSYFCQIRAQDALTNEENGGMWNDLSATMPNASFGMAVGYWDEIVTLIGGFYIDGNGSGAPIGNVMSFDLEHQIFANITSTEVMYGVDTGTQYYTQLGECVYMIQYEDTDNWNVSYISQYNLSDDTFNASFIHLKSDCRLSCLASSNDYLFLIHDDDEASSSVYQFSTNEWFHPNLSTARYAAACTVYGDYVYAIGGVNALSGDITGSIERMKISNDDWKWETVNYSMPIPVASAFTLPFDDGILVIGGEIDVESGEATDTIQVISFDGEKYAINGVSSSSFPALKRAVMAPGIIKVENQLLVFGGMMDFWNGTLTNKSQAYEFIELSNVF